MNFRVIARLDPRIWPDHYQLDGVGSPIALTQHALKLAQNEKSRIVLIQDDPDKKSELQNVWYTHL